MHHIYYIKHIHIYWSIKAQTFSHAVGPPVLHGLNACLFRGEARSRYLFIPLACFPSLYMTSGITSLPDVISHTKQDCWFCLVREQRGSRPHSRAEECLHCQGEWGIHWVRYFFLSPLAKQALNTCSVLGYPTAWIILTAAKSCL